MNIRGYVATLLNALPGGTRQPVQQAFDALIGEQSGVVAGTYGSSNAIPRLTVDGRGRVTAISESTFAGSPSVGNLTYSSAVGNEPSANAGDLYFQTNGFAIERYTGAAWHQWGPVFPLTEPPSTAYAWVNQGGASVDTTYGGIYLEGPPNNANSLRMRVKSAPSTPYTITVAIQGGPLTANFQDVGLIFRESATGKAIYFRLDSTGFFVSTVSSVAGIVANSFGSVGVFGVQPLFWRITDNGTNLTYSLSWDGQHFIQLYSASRTAYLASGPDQVGFAVNDTTNVYRVGMAVISWKET